MLFIVKGSLNEGQAAETSEAVEAKIKSYKGKITQTDKWGKRKFAYKIKVMTDGFYFLTTFSIDPLKVKELSLDLKIMDNVVRYLVVKLPEGEKEKKA